MKSAQRGNLVLVLLIVIGFAIIGFSLIRNSDKTQIQPSVATSTTYYGTGPCGDCPGIETTLTITPNSTSSGTFSMKMVYLERSVDPLSYSGTYTIVTGNSVDSKAKILELNPSDGSQMMYYQQVSSTDLQMLDQTKNPIEAPYNTTLTTTPPSGSPASKMPATY